MIEIYGKTQCPFCTMAKDLVKQKELQFEYKELGKDFDRDEMIATFPTARTFPQIILNGEKIGGYQELKAHLG